MSLPQFMVTRSEDLVVLGVGWTDFAVEPGAGGQPPRLVAQSARPRIALTFPPQSLDEQKFRKGELEILGPGAIARRVFARLAGPSRIEFQVAATGQVELSVTGILAALADPETSILPGAAADPEQGTAIELPWRLLISALATRTSGKVIADNAALPVESPGRVTGLWHTRLHSSSGNVADAGLSLLPLQALDGGADLEGFTPLDSGHRRSIVAMAGTAPLPQLKRLELSTLGGSLTVDSLWPGLEWHHDAVLGRDMSVRVVRRGVLYPFGHRAQVVESADRVFGPLPADATPQHEDPLPGGHLPGDPDFPDDFDPPPPPRGPPRKAVAGLQASATLTIVEPIRGPSSDIRLARRFPFAEVEILATSFTIKSPDWRPHIRQLLSPAIDALKAQRDTLGQALQTFLDGLPPTLPSYMEQGFGATADFNFWQGESSRLSQELADLVAQIPDEPDPVDPVNPDPVVIEPDSIGGDPPVFEEQPSDAAPFVPPVLHAAIKAKEAELATAQANQELFRQQVVAEFNGLPRSIGDLLLNGDTGAQEWDGLNRRIAELEVGDVPVEVYFTPRTPTGSLLQFPVRCAGRTGDVLFSVPMIFIADVNQDASEVFDSFNSLTDSGIEELVAGEWAPHQRVPLPGTRIDLVQAPTQREGDVHEVHELVLKGIPQGGRFRTVLSQISAELPALRELLPETIRPVVLVFTEDFLSRGADAPIALKPGTAITIDFGDSPDRSGGLVAPKFNADAISPTLGPVAEAALPGAGGDLSTILSGTTLLGIPLGELVSDAIPGGVQGTPEIVPIMNDTMPSGVRMTWKLPLRSSGLFLAGPGSKMELTVFRSVPETNTTCRIENFSLAIPEASPLVQLNFGSLVFMQKPGESPDISIRALDLKFFGALQLVKKLLDKLQKLIGAGGPTIKATTSGVAAEYALVVPNVSSGVFVMRNIAIHVGVDVPFTRKPVTVSLGFARRDNPFNLSVLMFGGGGYIDFTIGPAGLIGLEASMEFGAAVAVDFIVASGEVRALGGVRFEMADGSVSLTAFIRIGGSVEVLGLVAVSVELVVQLGYVNDDDLGLNRLVGRATLVIEVDVTLFSESVELDSGEWTLAGDEEPMDGLPESPPLAAAAEPLRHWQSYREAFAE